MPPTTAPVPPWRAWLVWGVGVAAYVVAILQRTSFGVAGLDAVDRFDTTAAAVSAFTVLQLLVYAVLQVPAGVLLDRFGTRRLVVTGGLLMAGGQLVLAFGEVLPLAVAGRVLVGAGDALTFISVLRLVGAWFPARQAPVVTQLTGLLGQIGQILSAVPLVALLSGSGWTAAFTSAAALGVLAVVLVAVVVRDAPHTRTRSGPPLSWATAGKDLTRAWSQPGTRLGLWSHFVTQFPGTVFALMWGFPFLERGEGVPQEVVSTLFTVYVVAGLVAGPLLGVLVARHPLRRSWLVLTIVAANAAGWTAVIAWPGPAPLWLLTLLVLALASGGPGSMVGFDYARTFNPADRQGTATGIVNVGGFVASLVTVLAVGVVLDATGGDYSLDDFRTAFSVQYAVWAVGVVGVLVSRRQVRSRLAAEGVVIPPLRTSLAERFRREGRG
ncbi:Sugar phosphate permease [Quadrisphaera granulorum]|uniref:Sugar phosphate permease n=1 Tax=Quadrisphaera granulorum TaxID=317664 RepID=A0A316ADV4_9ACTN|nr:MFS transporter [Quadrisphaera granulorum]PWJ55801.1 sugar phosphate permease [Quadrisphaera granulorum]SZE95298.1 Sugar phosphate permease [Quadrisphaera granulorum]